MELQKSLSTLASPAQPSSLGSPAQNSVCIWKNPFQKFLQNGCLFSQVLEVPTGPGPGQVSYFAEPGNSCSPHCRA